ncbi:hypothetical protein [Paraburkholderia phenoliruptrix]|uniref:hypothetical protein n=1 Tax=Paraburkholderia phenoliruptrix TaxID=252970 RepID=UPI002860711D|nr:hypothetical protein [Paraburkholderia phenoliruptrix]MDR6389262.1 hypothetical protein [Paraburkholderia phenoliruptrix]
MNEQWNALPSEMLGSAVDTSRTGEQRIDVWGEIQELAKVDPACRQAVDAVRYGRMTVQDAALALALCQTKRAMALHDQAVEFLKLAPMPPIVMPTGNVPSRMKTEG